MEIVVTGRNVEVPEHFRIHVEEKLTRLERYDHKIVGMEVELFHEPNRRQAKICQRVEITGRGRGPVVRAEACAQDFYAALDCAVSKLESRMRRSHDRRRLNDRRSRVMAGRGGVGVAVLESLPETEEALGDAEVRVPSPRAHGEHLDDLPVTAHDAGGYGAGEDGEDGSVPGRIVRRKQHSDEPISVDEALSRMELVGHDFYLFADAESGTPSVVYRRRGYDYGVISLGG
ncbi:ribosome-associated translation inhibitor RaiA [Pseudonocardia kujensis]|uniref:ribosome hibernation-promoting factor, HPF/YfiA family n=1 Tax=Pseudonocardia kujensis TaxID=1128675 RepID=UPI001E58B01E|nr:ribosome-associated translation inhibitor RaiA [Pseudonocardia kujensis]MCE0766429.1 ribosome-associated translation inhibitor RaiA [Pseudonocardia kujensis]